MAGAEEPAARQQPDPAEQAVADGEVAGSDGPARDKPARKLERDLARIAAREPSAARTVASSEPAVEFSEPPAPRAPAREREPTAASVFAKFEADSSDEHGSQPPPDAKALAAVDTKRKPFAKRSARGMRSVKPSGRH